MNTERNDLEVANETMVMTYLNILSMPNIIAIKIKIHIKLQIMFLQVI